MNVFVLCTGRCGSATFVQACKHISNYTAAHESRAQLVGKGRLDYPPSHIEVDNRLSWFLGRLDRAYGDEAVYVHLTRSVDETAGSYAKRWTKGIIRGYRTGILYGLPRSIDRVALCRDYCETVHSNIEFFLKDKSLKMQFSLETAKEDFRTFWQLIEAEGDLQAALREWDVAYNVSPAEETEAPQGPQVPFALRSLQKVVRVVRKLPSFLRTA